eukprot:1098354-Pelagomonas_calceolata.AAC.1
MLANRLPRYTLLPSSSSRNQGLKGGDLCRFGGHRRGLLSSNVGAQQKPLAPSRPTRSSSLQASGASLTFTTNCKKLEWQQACKVVA